MTTIQTIQRAYKVKLYPNQEQLALSYRYAGYARFAYNWGLAYAKQTYEETGKFPHWMAIKKVFNAIKYEEFPWTKELHQRCAEMALRDLGKAFDNWFRERKKGNGKQGFPKFKNRYHSKSFHLWGVQGITGNKIKLPGLGWIRYREPNYLPSEGVKYLSITISEQGGSWWASVQVEQLQAIEPATGDPIGVDLGIKSLAVTSDGRQFDNPKTLATYQKRLKRLQRKLSRQQRGSNNYRDTKRAIGKLHFKIACIRGHATHTATSAIVGRYEEPDQRPIIIVVEDLNVAGMMRNSHLASAVSDANMSEFRRQLEYKAAWSGCEIVVADRFYPSSKTCSACGSVRDELTLDERTFICPDCGFTIDRDWNAAINLRQLIIN
jgi:putative transposase